jgi:tRNA pseudouridine38-40 synthase
VIYYYRLTLQYKGTNYLGWQIQPENAGATIQGELNKALEVVSKSRAQSLGAGRTDAGVHALGQIAKVGIELSIDPKNLVKALNVHLPDDIRVLDAELSTYEFFPTVHAHSKEYQYRFTFQRGFSAFQNDLIVNHPFDLDLSLMQKACEILVGEHDFCNYFCEGTEVSSTVRKIFEAEIQEVSQGDWAMLPSHYVFRVVGNGFLKQMVRLLMGALWNVGRGKITLEDFSKSLTSHPMRRLGPVAPPQGLYMVRVNY